MWSVNGQLLVVSFTSKIRAKSSREKQKTKKNREFISHIILIFAKIHRNDEDGEKK